MNSIGTFRALTQMQIFLRMVHYIIPRWNDFQKTVDDILTQK